MKQATADTPLILAEHQERMIPAIAPFGEIIVGDALATLREMPERIFRCCVTSPPYWGLRDYGVEFQIGAEIKIEHYIENLKLVFREVRRTLTDDGTLWLNIGDSYTSGNRTWRDTDRKNPARAMEYRPRTPEGLKPKDLVGVPWRVALALQADGWYLRSDIIWHKPNCQPESVRDRPTRSHEYVFLLSKSERYYYDTESAKEPSNGHGQRNRRTVWSINTEAFPEAHFATFPPALVEPCVLAGSEPGNRVLDPFFGSGTVGQVCIRLKRQYTGIEINPEYAEIAERRLHVKRTSNGKTSHPNVSSYQPEDAGSVLLQPPSSEGSLPRRSPQRSS